MGNALTEALATPLWRWRDQAALQALKAPTVATPGVSPVQFVDVARKAGLITPNVWGGVDHKHFQKDG